MPSKIHTQLGEWNILGSGSSINNGWKEITNKLKDTLGLKIIKERHKTQMGYHGPWWEITKINGKKLPSVKKKRKINYINYNTCKEVWNDFKDKKNII